VHYDVNLPRTLVHVCRGCFFSAPDDIYRSWFSRANLPVYGIREKITFWSGVHLLIFWLKKVIIPSIALSPERLCLVSFVMMNFFDPNYFGNVGVEMIPIFYLPMVHLLWVVTKVKGLLVLRFFNYQEVEILTQCQIEV